MRPAPAPSIDLGGRVQIIDDSTTPPRWKTLARCFATTERARAIARQHNLPGVWLVDDYGDRHYVSASWLCGGSHEPPGAPLPH